MKKNIIIFSIIIVLVLYIIFLQWTIKTRNDEVTPFTRSLFTIDVWNQNKDIDLYLCVLEMLDRNDIDAAKERIQQKLYICIMEPPLWELMDASDGLTPDTLKAERIELLKRIKKYHEEHKYKIDMNLPSNKRAVHQLDSLIVTDGNKGGK